MEKSSCFQGVNKSSTAYKLLSKMGWQEGQGLGAQQQGITTHVKVSKKADASGVGAVQDAAKVRDWTLGMAAYDRVLASLKVVASSIDAQTGKKTKKRQRSADDRREEVLTKSQKKLRREPSAASQELESQRQGDASKSSKAAEKLSMEEASDLKERQKLATHVGRFKKVVKEKCVKGYSTHDLAAILGGSGSRQASEQHQQLSDTSSTHMLAAEPILSEEAEKQEGPGATGSEKTFWWSGHFVKAGTAGSASARSECHAAKVRSSNGLSSKPSVHISNFTEGDQANLWQSATDGQSKSRQGLGQADAPGKVGGVRWAGTKTRIGDSDDEGCQEEEKDTSGDKGSEVAAVEGIVIVPPKRGAAEAVAGAEVEANPGESDEPSSAAPEPEKAIKWRKIAKRILGSAAGNTMRLKAFKSQAWEAAAKNGATQKKAYMQSMLQVLSASSQFIVREKEISLRLA